MKKHLLGLSAAVAVLALVGPAGQATAQSADTSGVDTSAVVSDHGNWTLKEREDWLIDRLHRARDDGSINSVEYDRVHDDIDGIRDDENRLRSNHDGQLTDNETITLEARLDSVANQIHWLHEDKFRKPW